ncbi:hypothetical protein LzC2_08110 [Planctomycetes bacterium LzC2]|uniref:UspA domain-containing protein n=1 Tax=Alienimonas chondri TaxID=2681879 RepID=A0ABX1VCH5_9PLAN|nr:hypothetical protein [Alienimonas chondri]
MLFRHLDAAALSNALNGLFGADAVVIGGRGGLSGAEPRLVHASCTAVAESPQCMYSAKQPTMPARKTPATATPTPPVTTAEPRLCGPAARVWASWVVSRAVSA